MFAEDRFRMKLHAFHDELAMAQALVQAAIARHKQARLRPFTPAVFATYGGGGLGGGARTVVSWNSATWASSKVTQSIEFKSTP